MNEREYITGIIHNLLENGSNLILASIVGQEGSTPRSNGAKMVIAADGQSYGTIGGSLLEATAITEAKSALTAGQSKFLEFNLSNPDPNCPDMICGGSTKVLLDFIQANDDQKEVFYSWHTATKHGQNATLLTIISGDDDITTEHYLAFSSSHIIGNCPLSRQDIGAILSDISKTSGTVMLSIKSLTVIVDPAQTYKTLYCFGAGHVALQTAHIAALVGFHVVITDDRPEFANAERFPDASEIRVISDFNQAFTGIEINRDSFIVIVTRGHMYDRTVLAQSLRTKAGYIGMISSRKKRDTIYQALLNEGFTADDLARIHSPIGIAIEAETPEEIAVSIVAELIDERGKQQA
ncbi:XdhC family aldehyde oxidoreductase maturation factor [Chloroflexota bacterium]